MEALSRLPIEVFIQRFKCAFDTQELERVFTQGNCYHFAVILKDIYREGRIVYLGLQGHFAFKYQKGFYDITGRIFDVKSEAQYFDTMYYDDPFLFHILMRDCVLKNEFFPYGKAEKERDG